MAYVADVHRDATGEQLCLGEIVAFPNGNRFMFGVVMKLHYNRRGPAGATVGYPFVGHERLGATLVPKAMEVKKVRKETESLLITRRIPRNNYQFDDFGLRLSELAWENSPRNQE